MPDLLLPHNPDAEAGVRATHRPRDDEERMALSGKELHGIEGRPVHRVAGLGEPGQDVGVEEVQSSELAPAQRPSRLAWPEVAVLEW